MEIPGMRNATDAPASPPLAGTAARKGGGAGGGWRPGSGGDGYNVQAFSSRVGARVSSAALAAGTAASTAMKPHLSLTWVFGLGRTVYISCSHWWSQARKLPLRALSTSIGAPFSTYSIILAESVPLVSALACPMALRATYAPQAWFAGGLPYFLTKAATNAWAAGAGTSWCQVRGQMPAKLSAPAPQASAVSSAKPAIG